jgi:sugar phosphate isomerase/epimerase
MKEHTLGAQLYTVRAFTQTIEEIADTLERVADIGYRAIQISAFDPVDPQDVAALVEDTGLAVAGTHVSWDRFLNELDDVIAEHKMWGCEHAAIGGLFTPEYWGADGVRRFLDELAPVAERLAQEGIDFSYHNHNHELARYGDKTWLEMLYDQAPPEMLKAEIDTYWIQAGGGDPAAWIRKCAGREPLLHLKDMTVTPDREQRMAEVGEGNLNWPAILQAAE